MQFLAEIDWSNLHLSTTVALAAVALIGYLVGRRKREQQQLSSEVQARRELKRAQAVAKELERIAVAVRRSIATHHSSVLKFKDRVSSLGSDQQEAAWQELCAEAEGMLKPTLKLAAQLATAYDEIRQQSNNLMTFTEVRTDPLTGVSNRRALDETLESMFNMMHRYEQPFSVALLDLDHFKEINDEQGHLYGDRMLKAVARLLDDNVRDTDMVARYGGEEFVIVMPQTTLAGASTFSERLRRRVEHQLPLTVSCGVSLAADGDNPQTLLARADAALYSAKAAGRNHVFHHTGLTILPVGDTSEEEPAAVVVQQA
ncbi:MAG TPA: GGDEF domain-containing protein [Pirellulales bacterium]|nr:GGDEF domain-containing protein [Pirellulales bacterium]